ncbi:hypothetical protein CAPTEDRAFT_91824 [Capitella teleta]|uniref:guanylate cyclase n=1 Tax=Capitella teleta TaxID=283909 RepID=R7TXA1_CAPTE|nr:hypothetical protein CAPTEDRAFT_91824 [Capitella teleta]|eukprot:ELT98319.1 hypothetical protein CAPTEDRAFT_91824 [Capitella teleta]
MKQLQHDNLNDFIGVCVESFSVAYVVYAFCPRGSLKDIIANSDFVLDFTFKSSLTRDLISGMQFIHTSSLSYHGNLTSYHCYVDKHWVLKISCYDAGMFNQTPVDVNDLWRAPEWLRSATHEFDASAWKRIDIFSFGIILHELVYDTTPYFADEDQFPDILQRIRSGKLHHPELPFDKGVPENVRNIVALCLAGNPEQRPSFSEVRFRLRAAGWITKAGIVDSMILMLEKYTSNLESTIQDRTHNLLQEKKRSEEILHGILPRTIACQLLQGQAVEPEIYSEVTILFSDLLGFSNLCTTSHPIEIVNVLNDLYVMCDNVIQKHSVYKVETVGDSYMLVSGLPDRDLNHGKHIADVAIALMQLKRSLNPCVALRIGINTGPCAAGVVGTTMPRYCLFGDTVNLASRMQSNSLANRIQLSKKARIGLEIFPGYDCEYRGEIEIKGKGLLKTYWLLGYTAPT